MPFFFVFFISCGLDENISVVNRPDTSKTNSNYVSNRQPLKSSMFIKLPVTSVKPEGWLKVYLEKQRDGLTGNLGEISAWLQKEDNAWLAKDGKGKFGWEEVPYWLKGYANIGYILNDEKVIKEAEVWINAVIKNQRTDGSFGPIQRFEDGSIDFWGNMIMLYCLQSYYEFSGDERIIDLMTKYFKYQIRVPDEKFLTHYWQNIRGGDNLHSVMWLYNRTGDKFLLELAEKIHRNTADWMSRGNSLEAVRNFKEVRAGLEWPDWYGDQIDWHNVNHAQCFREPAQYYLLSKNEDHIKAAYENFSIIREHFGQVPGGMFGADENARPGCDDPRQCIETCGIVEQMNSDEQMLRISGDPFWADHLEEVAFNMYPSAVMPDFKSLHYLTAPNMVLCDSRNHHPGVQNRGPFLMMNPFSSRCCQHNHAQGWPYFTENLWMATPDNGVLAAVYCASSVNVKVGDGVEVNIKEETEYPFDDKIKFTVNTESSVEFPLYIRVPSWCNNAIVKINNKSIKENILAAKYVRIERTWNDGDIISLELPMSISVKTWEKNHNSVSVNYGPLTFSLKIKEKYIKKESDKTAIYDSKWQKGADVTKWPSFEIHPDSRWNYGLFYNAADMEKSFEIVKHNWPQNNFPFTHVTNPISIYAKGAILNDWSLDENYLCGELVDSPINVNTKIEQIELVPMGTTRLRISAFPVVVKSK
ncbi:MAG: glycoside hydrolase family 127 protein [Melioribacteraceae bacterium]|nr:glycoside hydrolase family 127 protein [Melioribacteraceae bacterium]